MSVFYLPEIDIDFLPNFDEDVDVKTWLGEEAGIYIKRQAETKKEICFIKICLDNKIKYV